MRINNHVVLKSIIFHFVNIWKQERKVWWATFSVFYKGTISNFKTLSINSILWRLYFYLILFIKYSRFSEYFKNIRDHSIRNVFSLFLQNFVDLSYIFKRFIDIFGPQVVLFSYIYYIKVLLPIYQTVWISENN